MEVIERKYLKDTPARIFENNGLLNALMMSEVALLYIVDSNGIIIKCGRHTLEVTGYSEDDIKSKALPDIMTPASRNIFFDQFPVLMKRGYNRQTVEVICKDGRIMTVDCFAFSMQGEDKRQYFLIFHLDITERIQQQRELQMFRAAVEAGRDGIAILSSDGKYIYVNTMYAKIFGYDRPEEIIGTSSINLCSEDSHKLFASSIMPQLIDRGYWSGELTGRRNNGSLFPQDVSLTTFGGLIACVTRDITGKKAALDNLNRSLESQKVINRILELSVEAMDIEDVLREAIRFILSVSWLSVEPVGAIFLKEEASGTIALKVDIGLTGHVRERCRTVRLGECLCGIAAMRGETVHCATLDERHSITYEGIKEHGHYCVPIIGAARETLGVLNVYLREGHKYDQREADFLTAATRTLAGIIKRDRLEKQRSAMEQRLLQSQKMEAIGQFAGGIAHDFNNLLTAIIGYGELARDEIKEEGLLSRYLDLMIGASEKASKLVQKILAFGRKQILDMKRVDLNEIVTNTSSLAERIIREDIEIRVKLFEEQLPIMADALQIEQVILNLVTNASDAMPNGGLLTIRTDMVEFNEEFVMRHGYARPGEYAALIVADSGVGMDEETRERIFEPYFTTKDRDKGSGIGLAMAYGIVKQHNGYINVYSEINKGTVFKIYFPLAGYSGEKTTTTSPVQQASHSIKASETILMAEDNAAARGFIKTILEKQGYRVIACADGSKAVEKFKRNKDLIDLVVLDVIMPGKNGNEAYEEMRKIKSGINVIFMSGYDENIIHRHELLNKSLNFIQKPFKSQEFLEKIRQALDSAGRRV